MLETSIKIENLHLAFGKYNALEDINLDIESGTFVSVVGPNGGGKTTLLKIILGLLKPTAGTIKINNGEVNELPSNFIGYVPQIKSLDRSFPASSIELVASGLRSNWVSRIGKVEKELILTTLERVGAEHLAFRQLSKLSGGELQRIYLARSFIRKPKILLLDEPATGIDLVGETDIHNIIDSYKKESNSIIIMVTHDWEAAYHHANKVLLLNRLQICYNKPEIAFNEINLRKAFSHVGHTHSMVFGAVHHD
jgi:zinc transport system ATP-binding protein